MMDHIVSMMPTVGEWWCVFAQYFRAGEDLPSAWRDLVAFERIIGWGLCEQADGSRYVTALVARGGTYVLVPDVIVPVWDGNEAHIGYFVQSDLEKPDVIDFIRRSALDTIEDQRRRLVDVRQSPRPARSEEQQ